MSLTQLEMFINDMSMAMELFDQIHQLNSDQNNDNNINQNRKLLPVDVNAAGDPTVGATLAPTSAPSLSLLSRLQDYQPKTELKNVSESCNQQLCQMYESALSCKVLGLGLKKTCAQYIISFLYDCASPFPPFYNIYQAPYYCIVQIKAVLGPLISGLSGKGLSGLSLNSLLTGSGSFLNSYINSNFSENCRKNCYQTYLNSTISFYTGCYPILFQQFSTVYKLPFQLHHFQTLRDQICVEGDFGNCYDSGRSMLKSVDGWLPSSAPTVASQVLEATPPLSDINVYDPQCAYIYDLNMTYGFETTNSTLCSLFNQGNCFGNIVNMISTGQLSSDISELTILPPCLLKFLTTNCNLDMNTIATSGSSTNMVIFEGYFSFQSEANLNKPSCEYLPNVYDVYFISTEKGFTGTPLKNGFLGLQGAIEHPVLGYMLALGLNYSVPLQTFITDFAYSKKEGILGSFNLVTPANGVPTSNNSRAQIAGIVNTTDVGVQLSFSYSIFAPGLNSSMIELLRKCMVDGCPPVFDLNITIPYNFCGSFQEESTVLIANYNADPFLTTKNSASSISYKAISLISTLVLIVYYAL